jgi:hypothetical protein
MESCLVEIKIIDEWPPLTRKNDGIPSNHANELAGQSDRNGK